MNDYYEDNQYYEIFDNIISSYNKQSDLHGISPKGVFWQSKSTQNSRFKSLLNIIHKKDYNKKFSISDFGCGYGALYSFIQNYNFMKNCVYYGYDIVPNFINQAQIKYPNQNFICSEEMSIKTDYTIISGTFNYSGKIEINRWEAYVFDSLDKCLSNSKTAMAFNLLMDKKTLIKNKLFYTSPEKISEFCKNYGETLIVKTEGAEKDMTIYVYK